MTSELDQPEGEQTALVERRETRRYAFICPAELLDLGGNTRISARTADLSLHGCYIDTLNPFPVGTRVRLQLVKNDLREEFPAEVASCHMGSGMGLIFEQLTPEQKDTIVSWLESTSSPAEASFGPAPSAAVSEGAAKTNMLFGAKLLKVLERKGVLTASEAADLLRDLNS
jgi:hypothetical protein